MKQINRKLDELGPGEGRSGTTSAAHAQVLREKKIPYTTFMSKMSLKVVESKWASPRLGERLCKFISDKGLHPEYVKHASSVITISQFVLFSKEQKI